MFEVCDIDAMVFDFALLDTGTNRILRGAAERVESQAAKLRTVRALLALHHVPVVTIKGGYLHEVFVIGTMHQQMIDSAIRYASQHGMPVCVPGDE